MQAPRFWYAERPGVLGRVLALVLLPLGWLYGFAGAVKLAFARPFDCGIPVICIGNLTAGGTGKTPIAIALAKRLAAHKPYLLTRGFGGALKGPVLVDRAKHTAAEVGDEALLLAAAAPTIVSADRRAGARAAVAAGAGLILMDDGFQNFALKKTLSLLVVDGARGFGNGHVLPAGPLREGVKRGLKRADAAIIMGAASARTNAALAEFKAPVFHADLTADASRLPAGALFAFAGIGQPEKFFATLRALQRNVSETRAFADHHVFAAEEIAEMRARAQAIGAALVTTEKDLVRLPPAMAQGIAALPVTAAVEEDAMFSRFLSRIPPPAP